MVNSTIITPKELIDSFFYRLNHINKNETNGILSGFNGLDRIINGFQKSDLILIGGAAGMGKTSFALSLIRNLAFENQIPTAFISLELSSDLLLMKMINHVTGISIDKLSKCSLNDEEVERINLGTETLENSPFFIVDYPFLTIDDIRLQAYELVYKHNIKILIIEELHLIAVSEKDKVGKVLNKKELTIITEQLKELAEELEIPILVFVNMKNEKLSKRPRYYRPLLSDLRKQGAIEKIADVVLFLYRPEYYKIDEWDDEMGNSTIGQAEIIVAKNHYKKLASIRVNYNGKSGSFKSLESSV